MAVVDEEVGAERASREVVDAARPVRHVPQHDALHVREPVRVSVSRKRRRVSRRHICVSRKQVSVSRKDTRVPRKDTCVSRRARASSAAAGNATATSAFGLWFSELL